MRGEEQIKHLEFIQGVINRMAGNSFLLKGWTVTIVSALFVLVGSHADRRLLSVVLLPVIVFWGLDAYYLRLERLYRALYDGIRTPSDEGLQSTEPFSMNVADYGQQVASWFSTLWSVSILPVYGCILVVSAFLILLI